MTARAPATAMAAAMRRAEATRSLGRSLGPALGRTIAGTRGPLATLVPTSSVFALDPRPLTVDRAYALSRFARLERAAEGMVLESPVAPARVVAHDAGVAGLLHALARPIRLEELAASCPWWAPEEVALVLGLLIQAGMVGAPPDAGLDAWEPHDLAFHAGAAAGRRGAEPAGPPAGPAGPPAAPAGPSAAPAGPAVPAVPPAGPLVPLDRPDPARLAGDPPFASLLSARRSIRTYGPRPITAAQLGEFLWRVSHLEAAEETCDEAGAEPPHEAGAEPPHEAGAEPPHEPREIELYVAVDTCDGLAAGLYHHDPAAHGLRAVAGRSPDFERLLLSARRATGVPGQSVQVLLLLAARFDRLARTHAPRAYERLLVRVGAWFQNLYLSAVAMDLAPCALGGGDSDLFARLAGTDYYRETSVGEFLLGSKSCPSH